jgi:hypothetical protein
MCHTLVSIHRIASTLLCIVKKLGFFSFCVKYKKNPRLISDKSKDSLKGLGPEIEFKYLEKLSVLLPLLVFKFSKGSCDEM